LRLGIDFGGTNIKTGIFSDDGKPIVFLENKLAEFTNGGDLLTNLIDHVKRISKDYQITSGGMAIKGLVNTETGILEDDIGAGALLAGKDLKDAFGSALQIPFQVDNDARSYAWGEYNFGAGIGSSAMVCMTLGTGVGSAVIAGGKPYYGSDPLGGLLGGHISIDKNGPLCPCGNKGCLELYCSATALTKRVLISHPEFEEKDNALLEFFKMIEQSDQKYFKTLYEFQDDLAIGIVNAIHAYGPDTVVLGGGVMKSGHLIIPRLTELVHEAAWTFPRKKVQIKISQLGNKAAALGIAFML
jgi:glucokinase